MNLALYDNNHNLIDILVRYSELSIESVLSTPDKILSFCYPKNLAEIIDYEGYIQTDTDEFVVKNKRDNDDNVSIQAYLNIEGLEGNVFKTFNNGAITLRNCLSLALDGSGWSIGSCPETAKRTMELMDVTDAWEIIKKCITTYGVEFKLDSLNKIVNAYTKLGTDKGIYFTDQLNLIKLDTEGNSDDFYTGIKAFGKDISVTLENHQYSNKKKYYIWKDERYTDLSSLTEDAKAKLDEMSKPSITYRCTVADLSKINSYYNFLSYELGDAVTLIDNVAGKKIKARIVRMTEYPNNPTNNTVDIGTNLITLERWFDNKFANYDYKLDNMNYNLNQLESNITNVNLKVDNLDNRVTNLEKGSGGATLDESIYIIDTTLLDSTDKTFALKSKYGTTIITDWGDGTTNNSLTHTYVKEGTYTIKTSSPYTPNTSSTYGNVWRACLIEIVKLNEVIENCTSSFYNFKNLKKVGDILGVTIANSMFKQCTSLVYPANLGEKIKDCRYMYAGCTSLLDTGSYRESMEQTDFMFDGCSKLQYTGYLPDSITSAERMFRDCVQLVRIDYLSNKLENAEGMFKGCTGLVAKGKNIVLPDSIKNASNMFCDCSSLNANIYWPSSLENASGMFYNCTNMENFRDLINLTNLTNMEGMFRNCTSATFSNVTKCPINVTNLKAAFYGCTKLQLPTEFFSNLVATAIHASWCFQNCSNLSNRIDVPINITGVNFMFAYSGVTETTRTVSSEIDYDTMYPYCTNLTTISDAMYELMQDTTYVHGLDCFRDCINIVNPDTYANLSSFGSVCSSWF